MANDKTHPDWRVQYILHNKHNPEMRQQLKKDHESKRIYILVLAAFKFNITYLIWYLYAYGNDPQTQKIDDFLRLLFSTREKGPREECTETELFKRCPKVTFKP